MKKIGLFGGTFDPVHNGHLLLAKRVLKDFLLDEIIFIPAGNPPHKANAKVTDKQHRLNMVLLATENEPCFSVSDFEITNDTPNYSYLTISHFLALYPEDEIYFIVGGDSFRDFPLWKNYRELLTLCTFIVVPRPGILPEQYLAYYAGDETPPRAFFLENFAADISSTDIRADFLGHRCALPACVRTYIEQNRLYRQEHL